MLDSIPIVGLPPVSSTEEQDEDNFPFRWTIQRRMLPISNKGNKKVSKETPTRENPTRGASQKFMNDAIKSNKASTIERIKRRKYGLHEKVIHDDR